MNKKSLFILKANLSSLPMQLIIRKSLIIILFILAYESNQSKLFALNNKFDDFGLISIMYHRFDESKYPSTNIQLDIFKKQLEIIENEGIKFIHPHELKKSLVEKKKRKILFTVDDGLLSFYENAWPILKEKKYL